MNKLIEALRTWWRDLFPPADAWRMELQKWAAPVDGRTAQERAEQAQAAVARLDPGVQRILIEHAQGASYLAIAAKYDLDPKDVLGHLGAAYRQLCAELAKPNSVSS